MKRKIAKSKKPKTVKKISDSGKHPILLLTEKIEKEFLNVPTKLASLCKTEYLALKHEEIKLNAKLQKAITQQKALEKKQITLQKFNHTVAGRKKITASKKSISQIKATTKIIIQEIAFIARIRLQLLAKQAKFILLRKELAQLKKRLNKEFTDRLKTAKKRKVIAVKRQPKKASLISAESKGSVNNESESHALTPPAEIAETS